MNMDAHLSPLRCNKLLDTVLSYPATVFITEIPGTRGWFPPWQGFAKRCFMAGKGKTLNFSSLL